MTQVVIRGESVYECDVCKRKVRVPTNRYGLDLMQRCSITAGCQGKLHRVTALASINDTPAFPPEVEGLQDWFPRNIFYVHDQPVRTSTWIMTHNLQNVPVLNVFVTRVINGVDTLVETEPLTVETVDANTTKITFAAAESGLAQCLSLASKNTLNYNDTSLYVPAVPDAIQLTSDTGEFTVATLMDDAEVFITATWYLNDGYGSKLPLDWLFIDTSPSVNSAWVGANHAIINGKRYQIRSFNIRDPIPEFFFDYGAIRDGSTMFINGINPSDVWVDYYDNPVVIDPGQVLFLLSNPPYNSVDRVYTQYVDAADIDPIEPELFVGNGLKGMVKSSIVKTVYPHIFVV